MATDGSADRPREEAPTIVARSLVQQAAGGSGDLVLAGATVLGVFWELLYHFLIQFILVWLRVWLIANGPMRVPFIRWRFQDGRLV